MSDAHYFSATPHSPAQERQWRVRLRGVEHEVTTANGIFSPERLDKGTQVLLEHVPEPPQSGLLLDVGCGWGPITLALCDAAPQAQVCGVEVNERARELAARNCPGAQILTPDELLAQLQTSGERIECLWSNPPIRIGKQALHDLLLTWLPLLSQTGEAWLVVSKNLGADSLAAWMAGQGYEVSREASSRGFRVLRVTHAR